MEEEIKYNIDLIKKDTNNIEIWGWACIKHITPTIQLLDIDPKQYKIKFMTETMFLKNIRTKFPLEVGFIFYLILMNIVIRN